MIPEGAAGNAADGEDLQLLADLFHNLSQPLTTLRCCLGLSLHKSPGKQNRRDLEIAMRAAESVASLVAGIRELVEAPNPPPTHAVANLHECLREVVDDLGPVAESMQLTLSLVSRASAQVEIAPLRLRQALFQLLGVALESCPAGNEVQVTTREEGENAVLTIQARARDALSSVNRPLQIRLALAIARRIFEMGGGRLQLQSTSDCFSLTIHLPRTTQQSIPPTVCA